MNYPERYEHVKFEDAPVKLRKHIEDMKKHRRGLYVHGPVGSGKTHTLYALARGAEEKLRVPVQFYNTTDLMRRIRDDFGRGAYDKEHVLERILSSKGVLILDDVGAERLTDWVLEQFYLIVNHRYEENLPTLYSSNMTIPQLAEILGDRITSRIVETCDIVALDGEDRRLKKSRKITL